MIKYTDMPDASVKEAEDDEKKKKRRRIETDEELFEQKADIKKSHIAVEPV